MNADYSELGFTQLMQLAIEDAPAKEALYKRVYDELHSVAHHRLNGQPRGELQTTAIVNEVVVRIERSESLKKIANRRVFFSVAAQAMKQVLIDHFRLRQRRVEHGTGSQREPLDSFVEQVEHDTQFDLELLSNELDRLQQDAPRQHAVIMHRYFGGLSIADTAELLDVGRSTVERDWRLARAKLFARLSERG